MYEQDILYGISKGTLKIPHKISCPYIERCGFYSQVKFKSSLFKNSQVFLKRPLLLKNTYEL